MAIKVEKLQEWEQRIQSMYQDRLPFYNHWQELANYYLPRRYQWLLSARDRAKNIGKNPYLLDGTGTNAARILAAGMMNGVTSPARPWFKLSLHTSTVIPQASNQTLEEIPRPVLIWLEEVQRRMLKVMAESNFYNALAVMYLDLAIFGTSAMLIYADDMSVIRCYTPALGEYYLAQSHRQEIDTFARDMVFTVQQILQRWPDESAYPEAFKAVVRQGGKALLQKFDICHIIAPILKKTPGYPASAKYIEYYWFKGANQGMVLERRFYDELIGIFPRWDTVSSEAYGYSPGMDALGDVIQLQHETKKKGQGLDKMVSPPMLVDIQLENRPTALLPNGITYVAGLSNTAGARPAYQVTIPLAELSADIVQVQTRIREIFYNPLFNMISQLDTVRSATEIDARREEKLVLLGGVLERFENEALNPGIKRIYSIMMKKGLLPPPPEELKGFDIKIEYESILAVAQRAVSTAPTERFLGVVGNLAALVPGVLDLPDFDLLLKNYARDIGVSAAGIRPEEAIAQTRDERKQQSSVQEALGAGDSLAKSAKNLAGADVGGGQSVLSQLMGG
jgi:hypothetical protein